MPCDVVILAATDRLDDSDPEEKTRKSLYPHEILNALGRAGRAGHAATGFAIVVPGTPIGCDLDQKTFTSEDELKVVFMAGDQCLPIEDPLCALFDEIEVAGVQRDQADYLLRRLAVSLGEEREGIETFEGLARRTFGYFLRSKESTAAADAWLATRRDVLTAVMAAREEPPTLPWQQELAAKTGASPVFISKLAEAFDGAPMAAVDVLPWVDWLISQFDPTTDETEIFLRPETTIRVFGRAITTQPTAEAARAAALEGTRMTLVSWFSGDPLYTLETKIAEFIAAREQNVRRPTKPDKKAKHARRFALRLAPDLGFLCGVLAQVAQKVCEEKGLPVPPMVTFASQLTRLGYPSPYHYALSRTLEISTRPEVIAAFEPLSADIDRQPDDDFDIVREKLEAVTLAMTFSDISEEDIAAIFKQVDQSDEDD